MAEMQEPKFEMTVNNGESDVSAIEYLLFFTTLCIFRV